MPQELHVLQCYNCYIYQVDIVKKIPKWSCKMCGEKQSLKKVFFKGLGSECRSYVQELNAEQGTKKAKSSLPTNFSETIDENSVEINQETSKWFKFTDNESPQKHVNETELRISEETVKRSNKWLEFTESYESTPKKICDNSIKENIKELTSRSKKKPDNLCVDKLENSKSVFEDSGADLNVLFDF